jgi:hypothetical protein
MAGGGKLVLPPLGLWEKLLALYREHPEFISPKAAATR